MSFPTNSATWVELASFLGRDGISFSQIGPSLPYGVRGTEIDILVAAENRIAVADRIDRFCRSGRIRLLRVDQPAPGAFLFVLGHAPDDAPLRTLHLHVASELSVGMRKLLDAPTQWPSEASPGYVFVYHLVKSVVQEMVSPARFALLARLLREEPDEVDRRVRDLWSDSDAARIVSSLSSSDPERLDAYLPSLLDALRARTPRSWSLLGAEAGRWWSRTRRPTGLFVAVLGPDGSGKTSVIDRLAAELEDTASDTLHMHFRPRFGAPQLVDVNCRHPHASPARGPVRSLLKVVFYAYDGVVSYFALLRPRLVQNSLVVFDRFFSDMLVDPVRYRYRGPRWVVSLFDGVVPKPDLLLVMDAPADVIQARAQEVSPEETTRQCEAYRRLSRRYECARLIDASNEPLQVARQARAVVLDHLEQAAADRLRPVISQHVEADSGRFSPSLAATA